jgi:hypothetical protein
MLDEIENLARSRLRGMPDAIADKSMTLFKFLDKMVKSNLQKVRDW